MPEDSNRANCRLTQDVETLLFGFGTGAGDRLRTRAHPLQTSRFVFRNRASTRFKTRGKAPRQGSAQLGQSSCAAATSRPFSDPVAKLSPRHQDAYSVSSAGLDKDAHWHPPFGRLRLSAGRIATQRQPRLPSCSFNALPVPGPASSHNRSVPPPLLTKADEKWGP